jgi:hypothetical protein
MTRLARRGARRRVPARRAPALAAANTGDGFGIETTTIQPSVDAFVNAGHPIRNSGSSRKLGADSRPHVYSYLRFQPSIGNATLASAHLGLYVRRGATPRPVTTALRHAVGSEPDSA